MSSAKVASDPAPVRTLLASFMVATALGCLFPAAASACWGDYPDAEEAFREGFTLFEEGSYQKAIERLKVAKEKRRNADPNCTVQLSARNPGDKAYYLPRFYLGVASYRLHTGLGDETKACEEALMFFSGAERKMPGETRTVYEKFRKRFREQARELAEIKASCDVVGAVGATSLASRLSTVNLGTGVE